MSVFKLFVSVDASIANSSTVSILFTVASIVGISPSYILPVLPSKDI